MREELLEAFEKRHGRAAEWLARAPGRVNLIGEHTDYQEGLVLPCAIDRATWVAAAPRSDGRVRVFSLGFPGEVEFAARAPRRAGAWSDYVAGPFAVRAARGADPPGLDLAVASSVPPESGLSSSAALEVAVARLLAEATGAGGDPRAVADVAHRAEVDFVGVACGRMDQLASALGRRGCALRIDCRSDACEPVPIGGGAVALLVAQSGVRRRLADGGYEARVRECRAALEGARAAGVAPAARALRDLAPDDLPALERALEPTLFRRARHVVRENARVDACCAALRAGDLEAAGALLRAGMESLRSDYEVSAPELDLLCEAGDAARGCFGSRLTGAGWGGCTLHLVSPDARGEVAARIQDAFEARFGRRPPVLAVTPSDGVALERPERP